MIEVIVERKFEEAVGIAVFELISAAGRELPPFSAGAHIDVHIAPGLVRQYSLCNNPAERGRYQIAVLKDPASRGGSEAMHTVVAGQRIQISEPKNHFPLEHEAAQSVLFAGGIGITPILCMAERLNTIGSPFVLHYSARSPASCAFRERLEQSSFAEHVSFHFDDGDAAQLLNISDVLGAASTRAHVYVCGPTGFIDFVIGAARAAGFAEAQLHREYFNASGVADPSADAACQVKLASTGEVLDVPASRSILEVLQENGFNVPSSCEQGVCGTCLVRVLEGVPDHRDLFLSPAEQALNDQMLPCCSRALSPILTLDL